MNTKGHHDVGTDAGIPALEAAFEKAGKGKPRLNAFLLGNWLSDVSQVIDPVATAGLIDNIKEAKNAVDQIIDELSDSVVAKKAEEYLKIENIPSLLGPARRQLHESLDFLAARTDAAMEAHWTNSWKDYWRLKSYFLFVHPETAAQPRRMDFAAFTRVFDERFTQYFPHEHLDRPELPPFKGTKQIAMNRAKGTRSPNGRIALQPDLYSYLRDDIEIIAGILAETDYHWASKTLSSRQQVNDADPEWNLALAKLGHAMHLIEDFFAHSTFIDLAAVQLGERFLPAPYQEIDDTRFAKRLKKLVPEPKAALRAASDEDDAQKETANDPHEDWRRLPAEDYVVTGTFDFRDSLISIAHMAEEAFGPIAIWGGTQYLSYRSDHTFRTSSQKETAESLYSELLEMKDPDRLRRDLVDRAAQTLRHPQRAVFDFENLFRQTQDFIQDPEKELQNPHNNVAAWLKKPFGAQVAEIRKPFVQKKIAQEVLKNSALFDGAPDEIKSAFVNTILLFNKGVAGVQTGVTLYNSIKTLAAFYSSPLKWLTETLLIKAIGTFVGGYLFYAREKLYNRIGHERIGSHSLLSKDHGREWLYKHQKECSKAVHWYVIKTLTRWADDSEEEKQRQKTSRKYVDWLELVEYFLRNPNSAQTQTRVKRIELPVLIVHRVKKRARGTRPDSLAGLAQLYGPMAINPSAFSWRTIADINFRTYDLPEKEVKDIVNQVLKQTGTGYPVEPPNYAFKPNTLVLIPRMKLTLSVRVLIGEAEPWYVSVMDKGWTVFRGEEDPEADESKGPLQHHQPVYIDIQELRGLINRYYILRQAGEEAYQPHATGDIYPGR